MLRGPNVRAQADAVRQAVWAINPDLPLASVMTMQQVVERSVTQFSFTMLTLGIAAGVALLLGAIGLYGVLSYAVSLRTREIGVRLALGAPPARVRRGVMANAAGITAIGLVVGAAGAAGLTRLLRGLLYETTPLDAATFAGNVGAAVRGGAGRGLPAGTQGGGGQPDGGDEDGIVTCYVRRVLRCYVQRAGRASPRATAGGTSTRTSHTARARRTWHVGTLHRST